MAVQNVIKVKSWTILAMSALVLTSLVLVHGEGINNPDNEPEGLQELPSEESLVNPLDAELESDRDRQAMIQSRLAMYDLLRTSKRGKRESNQANDVASFRGELAAKGDFGGNAQANNRLAGHTPNQQFGKREIVTARRNRIRQNRRDERLPQEAEFTKFTDKDVFPLRRVLDTKTDSTRQNTGGFGGSKTGRHGSF